MMRKQIKSHPRITILILFLIALAATILIGGYRLNWAWTGFTGEKETYRTLYDWLNLLGVLAIPVVVGFGAVWFTTRQGKVADAENKDNQRETALQTYIDKMSELLLHENLRESQPKDEARNIARVRTLTVLRGLDSTRKGIVLQFLFDSGLLEKDDKCIIDLYGADLSKADLTENYLEGAEPSGINLKGADLTFTDLKGANLSNAQLSDAYLFRTNLSGANLNNVQFKRAIIYEANFSHANLYHSFLFFTDITASKLCHANLEGAAVTPEQLSKAKSLQGATMPDGSLHP